MSAKRGDWGNLGRTDVMLFDPEDLTIVEDETSALFDERSTMALSENRIKNVMARGILQPISVRRNGLTADGKAIVEVVDGRQRVRWAREANNRLRTEGAETIRVPAVPKRGDDAEMLAAMIIANEHRSQDSLIVKAKKMARYLALGRDEAEAAIAFDVSPATVKNYLALLECSATVQKAVEASEIPMTAAVKLSKLDRHAQIEALETMRATGATKGKKAAAAASKASSKATNSKPAAPPMLGKKAMLALADKLKSSNIDDGYNPSMFAAVVLEYVAGRSNQFAELYPKLVAS